MKKFIVAAIVVIAIAAIAAPVSMKFAAKPQLETKVAKINASISKLYEKYGEALPPNLNADLRLDSYEEGLFGAKAATVLSLDGHDALVVESDISFGLYPTSSFPFIATIKTSDRIRLSDELLDQAPRNLPEAFKDGVLLEGGLKILPGVFLTGQYATRAIDIDKLIIVDPITIQIVSDESEHEDLLDGVKISVSLPSIKGGKPSERVFVKDIKLNFDGEALNPIGKNAASELRIGSIRTATEDIAIDKLKIKSASKTKGAFTDSFVDISADKLTVKGIYNSKKITLDKSYLSYAVTGADTATLKGLNDRYTDLYMNLAGLGKGPSWGQKNEKEMSKVFTDLFALFDKGAVIAVKFGLSVDGAPVKFTADIKTDPAAEAPKFDLSSSRAQLQAQIKKIPAKLIIGANFSAHQKALEALGGSKEMLEAASKSGVVKQDGDLWKTDASFKSNQWTVNGEELGFKGLFPSYGGGYGDDYDDDYENYGDDYDDYEGDDYDDEDYDD
ncbi:MAG: YdgA family protein [Helicobacteraceae bacterium]|jgi:hypothetical protein|nr:YdgA family protein [Helicobacteraceae bacterium]